MYQKCKVAPLLAILFSLLFVTNTGYTQVIAGIRANGRIMLHGDTIHICKGSSINYLSAAQGSLNIYWRFNGGFALAASGIGPSSVFRFTLGCVTLTLNC